MPKKKPPRARPEQPESALPTKIVVYASPAHFAFNRDAFDDDMKKIAPRLPPVEFRPDLPSFAGATARPESARRALFEIASARIHDPKVHGEFLPPSGEDLDIELLADSVPDQIPESFLRQRLYDGERVARAAMTLLPEGERDLTTLHFWVTRRLLLTYSPNDYRYHARFAVFGYPTLFSVLGLSYAPAPSLESALFSRALAAKGFTSIAIASEIDREYPEERVNIEDAATVTRAAASALLQASARAAGRDAFCTEPTCRLFNPHRKAEVVRSLVGGRLCALHAPLFRREGRGG